MLLLAGVAFNDALVNWTRLADQTESIYVDRRGGPRTVTVNNLKQLGIATHVYHDAHKHFPLGGTFDERGRGMHGWQTMILPYVEQQALFNRIDLNHPWNAPVNAEAMNTIVPVYISPFADQQRIDGFALSDYAGNVHVLGPTKLTMKDITDGASNTMLMGEVTHNLKPWGSPTNWRDPALGLQTSPDGFGGPRKDVTIIVLADASVRKIRNDISPEVLKALATPRGGEKIDQAEMDQ
jgi:hypothetical protein